MVSAPPVRVTVDQEPLKVPQVPLVSVAASRSTISLVASRPAPASAPQARVSGTDDVGVPGAAGERRVCPVGAVESGVIVIVAFAVEPAPLVAVTVFAPGLPVAPAVQA